MPVTTSKAEKQLKWCKMRGRNLWVGITLQWSRTVLMVSHFPSFVEVAVTTTVLRQYRVAEVNLWPHSAGSQREASRVRASDLTLDLHTCSRRRRWPNNHNCHFHCKSHTCFHALQPLVTECVLRHRCCSVGDCKTKLPHKISKIEWVEWFMYEV